MEIKNLRYFLAVAREENMSHAAEMLHVTQPTFTYHITSGDTEQVTENLIKGCLILGLYVRLRIKKNMNILHSLRLTDGELSCLKAIPLQRKRASK